MTRPEIYDAEYFHNMRGTAGPGDSGGSKLHENFLDLVRDLPLERMCVLDVGCGRGELLCLLKSRGAREIFGIDFSPDAVEITRRALGGLEDNVRLGSITDRALLPEGRFDLIFLTDVVEHLDQDALERGLANTRAWLAPGGRIFIHTFPTLGPHRIYQSYLKLVRDQVKLDRLNSIHCNVQTRDSLARTVERVGLRVERIWLENDLVLTSNVYQSMPPGTRKSAAKLLFNDLPRQPLVNGLARALKLEELISPSIYCECSKAP
jgi:cyclopropane fatty-acyl-phospholipid synthase-like methyltransferase